ncbi:hypothetical protein [Streptomyces bauhiniae]|uniref:hypothetical protein n=1 Tax=Streptomyces TaxID=1883 RepID=UPI0036568996
MTDSTPEDGEPTSFGQKTRNWYREHKPKIRAVGSVTFAVGMAVVAHLVARQDADTYEVEAYEAEGDADSESLPAAEAVGEPRQSPDPFVRNLPAGQNASEEKKAQYKAETGGDLEPGTTYVHRLQGEDPGEAAA